MCSVRWITAAVFVLLALPASSQSTSTIQGTITDPSGAFVPSAVVTVHNTATGQDRTTTTDNAGLYVVPALVPGSYRVGVKAPGMQPAAADLALEVGRTVTQNFALSVASASSTVEIVASAPAIEASPTSVGGVVNQRTVQEIPLNGRHFVDLALLVPGTVTPPQNGFLTAPLRGQGSFAFNTAGAREDQINYMVNGINLSDPIQNQITFQPTINTVQEFKVDNSTYGAEYGRNSGAIVNIATRTGTNEWHGEAYEFLRNSYFDARNYTNPVGVAQAPFKRNQFGGDGGGPIVKDKTFFFLSYEGLRQRQFVPLPAVTVLSDAQRAQAQSSSDPVIRKLLPLIPVANSPGNVFVSAAVAPVDIDQGTANFSHTFNAANRLNVYYAFQRDNRDEPPTTAGNTLPGYGDQRVGRRQLLTINETTVFSPTLVNEARLGYNRIHITFVAVNAFNAADYGMSTGVNAPIGLPQITVAGAFAFGGINGEPQGRGDYSAAASDTLTWVHGKHSIKFGGEYRRIDNNNFSYTPGTFNFPNIQAFLNDQANSFTANSSNRANRIFVNSIGAFVEDSYKWKPNVLFELGLRYDWYGTPTEALNRFVVFDPTTVSLAQVGTHGISEPYNQSALNFQPRAGFSWDVFNNSNTVVRGAYAIMTDQPITGLVNNLTSNPPFSFPVSFSPTAATPSVSFSNAFSVAGGIVSPTSVSHSYKDSYAQEWNLNVQQRLPGDVALMVGYFANKGTDLNIPRNYNQFINGARPYPVLSANSPILPGSPLGNILVYESVGNSSYNALWVTGTKRFSRGLQFDTSYTFSKSIDYNSRNLLGLAVGPQDSYNLRNDRGLSDFDARHRVVVDALYDLPFHGNRLKEGWEFSTIFQAQSGNPINFHTSNAAFTGVATLRPSVTGSVVTGFNPATNGAATNVTYLQNPGVFYNQGSAFGNLGRNVLIGPGFWNLDFALVKNTKITERVTWQVRADAFDLFNHPNFGQPGTNPSFDTLGTATFNLLTSTRFPAGDSGSSRQLQLAMKLIF